MADPTTTVVAPPRTPRRNTSLDILPVIDGVPGPFLNNQFVPDPCAFPNLLPKDCWISIGPVAPNDVKLFGDAGDAVVTDNFGAYQGVECWLPMDEFSGIAERVLTAGEYRVVDGALASLLIASATSLGSSVSSMTHAVGMLDAALAAGVPAQGYILAGIHAVTHMANENLLVRNLDGTLETYIGTPVIPLSEPSLAFTVFASGPITIWRGPIVSTEAPDPMENKGRALAERLFSIAIECDAWKITFDPFQRNVEPDPNAGPLVMVLGSIPSSPIPDGTDVTAVVQTNQPITDPIEIWYSLNGGPDTLAGEATQVDTLEHVFNADESITVTGDSVEVWALTTFDGNPVESNHITIEVT